MGNFKKFDIGFDLSLINRIHLTFDYYNEETSDALFEVPLSMTTGMSTVYQILVQSATVVLKHLSMHLLSTTIILHGIFMQI